MLESLYQNNSDETINVYIIYSKFSKPNWKPLLDQAKTYKNLVIPIPVDEKEFSHFPRVSKNWPRLLYFKLLASDLLPKDLDRVLLLESDMIITKPLSSLYHTSFDGHRIVACRNLSYYWGNIEKYQGENQKRLKQNLSIPEKYALFGAGVILINLVKMREDNIGLKKLNELAQKFNYSWGSPEESLFWALFYNSRKDADPWSYYLLPNYWREKQGSFSDFNSTYGSIIHYSICNKPWDSYVLGTECELDKIWWSYAKRTVFFDDMKERFETRLRERMDYKDAKKTLQNVELYYHTIVRWKYIQDSIELDSIKDYFRKKGYFRIAVYGQNLLQMLLCHELKDSEIVIPYLVDSFESGLRGNQLIKSVNDCSFQDVDCVVVAAFLHYDSIKEHVNYAPCPVLSLHDIIEEMLPESFNQYVI